jgi:hypothetical protein
MRQQIWGPKGRSLCTGGLDPRDLKTALLRISFLRKGEVLAYVGRIHNLKDLIDLKKWGEELRGLAGLVIRLVHSSWG